MFTTQIVQNLNHLKKKYLFLSKLSHKKINSRIWRRCGEGLKWRMSESAVWPQLNHEPRTGRFKWPRNYLMPSPPPIVVGRGRGRGWNTHRHCPSARQIPNFSDWKCNMCGAGFVWFWKVKDVSINFGCFKDAKLYL